MQIRNYTPDDFEDYLRINNEMDIHGQTEAADDIRASFAAPKAEPEKNVFMIIDGGKAVGKVRIFRSDPNGLNRHHFHIALPEYLQNDEALLDDIISVSERRIAEISDEYEGKPLQIRSGGYEEEEWFNRALERHGYTFNRYYARLDLNDISELPQPEPGEGIIIRTFDRVKDGYKYLDAFNLGFTGHFEHQPATVDEFDYYLGTHWYRPELYLLAEIGGEIVGVCMCFLNQEPEADGYLWGVVQELGIIPDWRGKGLGRALIRAGHRALRKSGAQKICLWVDYANPFGAKNLYYGEGYVDRYIEKAYAKDE